MIVCHVCGTENQDGAKFCEGCGVELSSAPAPVAAEVASAPVVENAPAEIPVVEAPVVEALPLETAPVEAAPIETVPVEAPPLEAAPVEVAPVVTPVSSSDVATSKATIEAMADGSPMPSDKPKVARLIPRAAANASQVFMLHSDRMVVGRFDPSAGPVDIDCAGLQGESYISRRHAELYLENGQWMVRDLGSTNGVYVKHAGQAQYSPRIIEPAALNDGDELAFGNLKFLFLNSSETA
jgi:FHA domain/zinc-ribbon domain